MNDDLISRQAAYDLLIKLSRDKFTLRDEYQYVIETLIEVEDNLKELPSAQPAQTPCDLCAYDPPSSGDGKPCSMCPASARKGEGK